MATIALYAGKINNMPGLVREAKNAVSGLNTQLATLKRRCERVNASVCNIDNVISLISASTRTQEEKIEALEALNENVEDFARETVETDERVAEIINENREDFYDKYSYLKPDSEKSVWEKIKDGVKKIGEWCKEHWKAAVTIALVVAAIVVIVVTGGAAATPLAMLLLGAAKGVLIGAAVGGIAGGITGALFPGNGKSAWEGFWEGFENGAFGGALSGMLSGMATTWLSYGFKITEGMKLFYAGESLKSLSALQTIAVSAGSEGIASFVGGILEMLADGKAFGTVCLEALHSAFWGGVFGGLTYAIDWKPLIKGITKGKGSWSFDWISSAIGSLRHGTVIGRVNILKGLGSEFLEDLLNHVAELIKSLMNNRMENAAQNLIAAEGGAG